jgi:acyl-CoA synthetase (NDP forming)
MSILDELRPMFYPQSHAVIGASSNLAKFGGRYFNTQISYGYRGRLYPVNPQEAEIKGFKAYPRVGDIPGPVEFATISVPAPAVPGVLEECLARGVKAAQILSAGFGEKDEEGKKLEENVKRIARRGIRVIGPNCFGVYCPAGGLTILPGENLPRESGPVAFMSQSGGYAIRVPQRAAGWGVRFSKEVSYGNAVDINECDLLEYFLEDPETKIICSYLEGVKDGRRFLSLLKKAAAIKPVIIWKGGLTEVGSRAVQSHTASLAGNESVWNTVYAQSGALRVNSLEELLDAVMAFLLMPAIRGRRFAPSGEEGA